MARKPARARAAAKRTAGATRRIAGANGSYLEWSPVLGGTALALAISAVLFQFGSAVGLSAFGLSAPATGKSLGYSLGILAAGIWILWVPLVSAAAGGYLAGMMRAPVSGATSRQVELRDGAHGLTVWAVATLGAAAGAAVLAAIAAVGADNTNQAANTAVAAKNAAIVLAFAGATGAVLSAGVAWWAATMGGEHRDRNIDVHKFVPAFLR